MTCQELTAEIFQGITGKEIVAKTKLLLTDFEKTAEFIAIEWQRLEDKLNCTHGIQIQQIELAREVCPKSEAPNAVILLQRGDSLVVEMQGSKRVLVVRWEDVEYVIVNGKRLELMCQNLKECPVED
jgi:hypothetical protein